jgi:hypothetical protein
MSRRPALGTLLPLALCGVLGCDSSSVEVAGDAGAGGGSTSEDGSEVTSSVEHPTSLELLSELDVTPDGALAHRPDVTAVNGQLWLAYATAADGFRLQRFDLELSPIGAAIDLEDATEQPTDVRVASLDGQFWYAYETATIPSADCEHNFLSVARYATGEPPALAGSARHIATGCPTSPTFIENPSGVPAEPEAADDPTPFSHGGVRYVLTRVWPGVPTAPHHLRRLDAALGVAEETLLDTTSLVPGGIMGQNVLIHIGGRPFLVAGFPSGPPMPPATSALWLLEVADDLQSFVGTARPLAVPDATYPQRITRARHVRGTLILNYTDRYAGQATREIVALFDAQADFAFLSETVVQNHEVADSHSSFEVVGDRLYLFQQQDGERLSAKIFRLVP